MNVLVIYGRDLEKGSTKYRVAQYAEYMQEKGVHYDFHFKKEITRTFIKTISKYDAVINQRCLIRTSLAKKIISQSRRLIFDFDDAIYICPGKPHSWITSKRVQHRMRIWIQGADRVTTPNHFLADYAKEYTDSVTVIPNVVDMQRWQPARRDRDDMLTIGWAGAPVNVSNVENLEPVFSYLLRKHPLLRLSIFSGEKPNLSCPFEYYPFVPGKELDFVQQLDIGLLPVVNEEFSKGKSSIKAIQYLACGIPVVANILGATAEILNSETSIAVDTHQDWLAALETLISDPNRRKVMGRACRKFAEQKHDINAATTKWLDVLQEQKPSGQAFTTWQNT